MIISYVNKNQSGYDTMGVIIDTEEKTIRYYPSCTMPIGNHIKLSKKKIREIIELYEDAGYTKILKM